MKKITLFNVSWLGPETVSAELHDEISKEQTDLPFLVEAEDFNSAVDKVRTLPLNHFKLANVTLAFNQTTLME